MTPKLSQKVNCIKSIHQELRILPVYSHHTSQKFAWTMSSIPPNGGGGNKTKGSNNIMSTLFALKCWSNKIIFRSNSYNIFLLEKYFYSRTKCALVQGKFGALLYNLGLFWR